MDEGIRFASTDSELHAAYNLRYRVYVESMGRFADKCDHDKKELTDSYDQHARILIAVSKGEVVATLRLLWGGDNGFDPGQQGVYHLQPFLETLDAKKICIVERLILEESRRGSAMMLKMLNAVMHFVFEQQIELLLINAESKHQASYEKLGCSPFGKRQMYPGIGPTTPMALNVGDFQHLQSIASPFALLASPEQLAYCKHTHQLKTIIADEAVQANASSMRPLIRRNAPTMRTDIHAMPGRRSMEERWKLRLAV